MRILIRAHNDQETSDVNAAIVKFEPKDLLALMDRWQELDNVVGDNRMHDFRITDDMTWVEVNDYDALRELDKEPFIEFESIKYRSIDSKNDKMVVTENGVYWTTRIKYTDVYITTQKLTFYYINKFYTAVDRLGDAVKETQDA